MKFDIKINDNKVREYIDKIHIEGGICYVVGGYVRDSLLGRNSKDIDIEVHNIEFNKLKEIFKEEGEIQANFGVLILKSTFAEFAIPRRENKIGIKHTDFEINLDPYMSEKDAAYRRDFTINSMMYNLKNKELIDNYNGLEDLNAKVIKHIGDKFSEDPLRVLRAIRFSFELGFEIDKNTIYICSNMLEELKHITPSRKNQEISKMFNVPFNNFKIGMKSFEAIMLKYFLLEDIKITMQKEKYHPEGSVWEHTKQGMYLVNLNRKNYANQEYKILMLAIFLHDIGKIYTTDENLSAHGHETKSVELTKEILDDILINKNEKKIILNLIEDHMYMHILDQMRAYKILKILEKYKENINLLIEIGAIDSSSRLEQFDKRIILENYEASKKKYMFLQILYDKVQNEKKIYNGHYFMNLGYKKEQIKVKQQEYLIKFIKNFKN